MNILKNFSASLIAHFDRSAQSRLLSLLVFFTLFVSANSFSNPISDLEVGNKIMSALSANPKYIGMKTGTVDHGAGTFCRKESSWSYTWQAELEDIVLTLKPEEKAIDLVLKFRKVAVEGSGFRTGGVLCTPMGGVGRAGLDDFNAQLRINKMDAGSKEKPLVELQSLRLKGLKINHVSISLPFFNRLNGQAPDWLNDFIEANLNSLSTQVLGSSLSRRINNKLSDVLARWIEQAKDNGFDPIIGPVSDKTFTLDADGELRSLN